MFRLRLGQEPAVLGLDQPERTAAQRADRRAQQTQAEHQAAKTELRTAQLREQAARIEAAAQDAEDFGRLWHYRFKGSAWSGFTQASRGAAREQRASPTSPPGR
ncbi:hypothetical protein ACFRAA_23170 [[Kitasatospora] papulosa]|uniref:hypothetical protein n=1 Tax=[Kitasatospora] papulosa TaxID=1464011 RepID=UPI0036384BFE